MTPLEREEEILGPIRSGLESEGYTVYRRPPRNLLPPFMQRYGYVPDLVALGKPKNVAIEVLATEGAETSSLKQAALVKAFEGQNAWELRVVYAKPRPGNPLLKTVSGQLLQDQLVEARTLLGQGQLNAALLIGWAVLEASARGIQPSKFSHPQPPSRLVEALASLGEVTPSVADTLRKLAHARNRVAHGMLDEPIQPEHLEEFLHVLGEVVGRRIDLSERRDDAE